MKCFTYTVIRRESSEVVEEHVAERAAAPARLHERLEAVDVRRHNAETTPSAAVITTATGLRRARDVLDLRLIVAATGGISNCETLQCAMAIAVALTAPLALPLPAAGVRILTIDRSYSALYLLLRSVLRLGEPLQQLLALRSAVAIAVLSPRRRAHFGVAPF